MYPRSVGGVPDHPDDAWLADRLRTIADRIRLERKRQNRTQEWLYLTAGVSRWAVQDAESGLGNPTTRTLLRIARALDVPLSTLLERED
ncbi:helix-turn-helix transcriptional regulator [Streptomyces canus]|uniref:helix-turn-helix transcriptional regulator n=1 Tax=Streptomyces canus TaxID=58343 RepID=UPI00036709D6|nr:helix-turn-helix transcriptional regulator [Streptomyces canus]